MILLRQISKVDLFSIVDENEMCNVNREDSMNRLAGSFCPRLLYLQDAAASGSESFRERVTSNQLPPSRSNIYHRGLRVVGGSANYHGLIVPSRYYV